VWPQLASQVTEIAEVDVFAFQLVVEVFIGCAT
jgi:hypothetical protein